MKKTTQIHIGGRHFFIDDDAFQKLSHYLDSLKRHFSSDGETGSEIVEDIEQRIAELLENKTGNGKQAITLEDINETIRVLGNVEDFVYAEKSTHTDYESDYGNRKQNRRFYRDPDNYYFGGVASGMGAYFDIDPLWIRLTFVLLFFAKGAGLLIYLILWVVVPKARTTTEKLQMKGKPVNLSTIKDSVNEEYEKVRDANAGSMDRTRSALENLLRAMGLVIVAVFKFIIGAIGVLFLVIGSVFLAGLIMAILGFTNFWGHFQLWDGIYMPDISGFFANSGHYWIAIVALVLVVLIPIVAIIYGGIKILFNIRTKHPVLRAFLLTGWILALVLFITLVIMNIQNSPVEASGSKSTVLETKNHPHMIIDVNDNLSDKHIIQYRILGMRFNYSRWDDELYNAAQLNIEPSKDEKFHLIIQKNIKNMDMRHSDYYLDEVMYDWNLNDSVIMLDKYYRTEDDDFWMFPRVELTLKVPEGKKVVITQDACEMFSPSQHEKYCDEQVPEGKKWLMSPEGALVETR